MASKTPCKKDESLCFLFLGYGGVTTGFEWDYDSMTVLALKQKLGYLWYLECKSRRTRLYQVRRIDEDDTAVPPTNEDWLCISALKPQASVRNRPQEATNTQQESDTRAHLGLV